MKIYYKYGTCPCCGAAVNIGVRNGSRMCPKCKKTLVIQDGEIRGWR